jgi:carboxymethylenebutenolidase
MKPRAATFVRTVATALALTTALTCYAQDWAKAALAKSPRHTDYVTIPEANGRKLQAFVVYPEVKDKAPVVVLIHEIFGESDWFKLMADDIASAGYIVVAPDLLSDLGPATGAATTQPMAMGAEHDHMQMGTPAAGAAYAPASPGGTSAFPDQQAVVRAVVSLPDAQVLADLDAAADWGKKQPSANGKLFIAGFCWGGGKSFLYATHRKDLSAAFVFYGPPPAADLMKNITAPVYGFYAGNDARISTTVPQTTLDMKAAGKTYEPVIYDGAGHGFMRAGEAPDANAANAAARQAGFHRLIHLLGGMQ